MRAEFRESNYVIRVSTSNAVVSLTIERPGEESVGVFLPLTTARAVASAMMGAAAELKGKV